MEIKPGNVVKVRDKIGVVSFNNLNYPTSDIIWFNGDSPSKENDDDMKKLAECIDDYFLSEPTVRKRGRPKKAIK